MERAIEYLTAFTALRPAEEDFCLGLALGGKWLIIFGYSPVEVLFKKPGYLLAATMLEEMPGFICDPENRHQEPGRDKDRCPEAEPAA